MAAGERADFLLVAQGLCDSREQAKRLIMAGEVMCGTERVAKPSTALPSDAVLTVLQRPRYVGRGGLKMEGALKSFGIVPAGWVCLDIGASTGGFTDSVNTASEVAAANNAMIALKAYMAIARVV